MIFFRDQSLSPSSIWRCAACAPIDVNRFFAHAGPSRHRRGAQGARAETNIGGGWHTDHSYDGVPAMGSILLARELPAVGGDTLFASMYRRLEPAVARPAATLAGIRAVHRPAHVFGAGGATTRTRAACRYADQESGADVVHPVVIRHPAAAATRSTSTRLHAALRRLDGRGQPAAARAPVPTRDAAGFHLPLSLARGLDRVLGQSGHVALCRQRLSGRAAAAHRITRRRLQARGRQRLTQGQALPVISASWSSGA